MPSELFHVYVERGRDRGWGGRSSPVFVLSAVNVRERDRSAVLTILDVSRNYGPPPPQHVMTFHISGSCAFVIASCSSSSLIPLSSPRQRVNPPRSGPTCRFLPGARPASRSNLGQSLCM